MRDHTTLREAAHVAASVAYERPRTVTLISSVGSFAFAAACASTWITWRT